MPFFVVWLIALFLSISCPKTQTLLWVNGHPADFLDVLFPLLTHMGDTVFYVVVMVVGLMVSYRFVLYGVVSGVLMAGVIFVLKLLFDHPRPIEVFGSMGREGALRLLDGVEMYTNGCFPSGHTTSAFALFFMVSLFAKSRFFKFLCFLGAVTVAYTRMYLAQHFLEDVVFGSVLGVLISFGVYRILNRSKAINRIGWIDRGLLLK